MPKRKAVQGIAGDGKATITDVAALAGVVLPALAELLEEMESLRVAHRNIRPNNIFVDADTDQLIVGECFSVPAGFAQAT